MKWKRLAAAAAATVARTCSSDAKNKTIKAMYRKTDVSNVNEKR